MERSLWEGRRDVLASMKAGPTTHAGLWLDRYLEVQTCRVEPRDHGFDQIKERAREAKSNSIASIEKRNVPVGYEHAFATRAREMEGVRTIAGSGAVVGRMVIGSGAKGAGEFGLTLQHTWGVPFLPGSSLKGIAALAADRYFENEEWKRPAEGSTEPNSWEVLFGDTSSQGAVVFHDAWWVPSPRIPIHADVLTVHHKQYYEGTEPSPHGMNDPIPVPFVSVSGSYWVVIEALPGVPPLWLERAWEALRLGLERHGIGAKVNAGYGRLELPAFEQTGRGQEIAAEAAELEERRLLAERVAGWKSLPPRGQAKEALREFGAEELRRWLLSQGQHPVAGLAPEREVVSAVVVALYGAQMAKGLTGEGGIWSKWIESALADIRGGGSRRNPRAKKGLEPGELDKLLKPRRPNFNRIATQLAGRGLSDQELDAAEVAMRAKGAKDGHIKVLRNL